jgi:hypothetical protein
MSEGVTADSALAEPQSEAPGLTSDTARPILWRRPADLRQRPAVLACTAGLFLLLALPMAGRTRPSSVNIRGAAAMPVRGALELALERSNFFDNKQRLIAQAMGATALAHSLASSTLIPKDLISRQNSRRC